MENIRKAIDQFPWAMRLTNIDVNERVNLFNKTIKNIILNYIPRETITCHDSDPPWINKDIKELIQEKNQADKSYGQNKNNIFSRCQFELLQSKLNSLIEKSKFSYCTRLSKKLSDLITNRKSYWSLLKTFLNNKKILSDAVVPIYTGEHLFRIVIGPLILHLQNISYLKPFFQFS